MKTILILLTGLILMSCAEAKINDAVVVEQINILDPGSSHKYEVTLKSSNRTVFYYTNFRHQVGDTLISYYEFFENKKGNLEDKNLQIKNLTREKDSIKKELEFSNYYLRLLQGKLIFDTIKRK